ncbi:GPR1/FUN34/yaaH family-domain-containing protein [Dipodascopsis uninucleata]
MATTNQQLAEGQVPLDSRAPVSGTAAENPYSDQYVDTNGAQSMTETAAPNDSYDLEDNGRSKEGQYNSDELLSRIRSANSVTISPELFEKLYLSPQRRVKGHLRQTFANPTPLALLGHILCITPLSCDLMGWRGAGQYGAAGTGAYTFLGGMILIISGILEFFLGNTFSFVVFSGFGGFWLSFAATLIPSFNAVGAYSPTGDSLVLGIVTPGFQASFAFYLCFWAVVVLIMMVCSLRTNIAFFLLFVALEAGFISLTVGYFYLAAGKTSKGNNAVIAAGALLFACGMFGFYIFLVLMLVAVDFPFLLPVGDLSKYMRGYQQKHGPIKP